MKKIAISIGDLNGVGLEIALKAHKEVQKISHPLYCINTAMLKQGSRLLGVEIPSDFEICEVDGYFDIEPSQITSQSGKYSYDSFTTAIELCAKKEVDAIVTLPIHKESWSRSGIKYKGHTEVLRDYFKQDAIMMLGCEKLFVALYSEHIPLCKVASTIKSQKIEKFLLDFSKYTTKVAVLALNPHGGDGGVLGSEDIEIKTAIEEANKKLNREIFFGPFVPDTAFTPHMREKFNYFVAMYHDQGLAPLKALYFDESINVSLNLPILRVSVDHGTAFDIAYKNIAKITSYINAIEYVVNKP